MSERHRTRRLETCNKTKIMCAKIAIPQAAGGITDARWPCEQNVRISSLFEPHQQLC